MLKRQMIQLNLIKNSVAAYFAAIEIHNKPNISYRYETVTLLILNAWELALKAYVRKYIKNRSIFKEGGHTISVDQALDLVNNHINAIQPKSFSAKKKNIEIIKKYRDDISHFYSDELEPYIFMVVAQSILYYIEFMKEEFSKDIMEDEGLFIMPIGFKLPFKPVDYLSNKTRNSLVTETAKEFVEDILNISRDLKDEGIEDSIVLGFGLHLESVKKEKNSDILAAITTVDEADLKLAKRMIINATNDPGAQLLKINDYEFREAWPYTHDEMVAWCRKNIKGFKKNMIFNDIKRELHKNSNYVFTRLLDSNNPKSQSKAFYSESALQKIKDEFEKHNSIY